MTLLFVMGVLLVLAALVLVATAVGKPQPQGMHRSLAVLEAMSSAPSELTQELDRPFAERVLAPLQARALGVGKRITGSDSSERIRRKLDLAGNPLASSKTWTFSTEAVAPPILVIDSPTNPYTTYTGEILEAEGMPFARVSLPLVTTDVLNAFDVVVLGTTHEACRRFLGGAPIDAAWMVATLPRLAWASLAKPAR